MHGTPDRGGRWLWVSVISFGLMMAVLYLGQGLPSLLYVVLVLGLIVLSIISLFAHHFLEVFHIGRLVADAARASRRTALVLLFLSGVVVITKLLGWW
jgi:hypothetical protein